MRSELKRAGSSCLFYLTGLFVILGMLAACGYFGLTQAAYAALDFPSTKAEQTRLEAVAAGAREIRAALSKPMQPLAPLGPVREKAANSLGGPKIVARQGVKPRLTHEAANAFASSATLYPSQIEAFDRHRPQ